MKNWTIILGLSLSTIGSVFAEDKTTGYTETQKNPPLETVEFVDVPRYMGKWYEIANFPQKFQKNCYATTATYELRKDGKLNVINACRKGSVTGKLDVANGRARVINKETNAHLKVNFVPSWIRWMGPAFRLIGIDWEGDYFVIELGDDYEYAVVGHPSRDYLWILNREPHMDLVQFEEIKDRLVQIHKYNLDRLVITEQP